MQQKEQDIIKVELQNALNGDYSSNEKEPKKSSIIQVHRESVYSDRTKKIYPEWQTTSLYKFIQFWQSVFNRRIVNFCNFTIQVGDVLFFLILVSYLMLACILIHKEKKSGKATSYLLGATIVFGCRNGLLSYVFGLSFERAIFWHKLMAWITLGLSLNHWYYSKGILSGYAIESVLIAFIVFSIEPIRRYLWEFFMKVHWILIISMFVCCIIHEVGLGIAASVYFALDIAFRIYEINKHKDISVKMNLEKIGSNIVKISMKKDNVQYKGGQYFFIMIPKLSYFQWHPFSIFSAPNEDEIVFYIKSVGDWTNYLYKIAGEQNSPVSIQGYLDGPYGSHSISLESDKYQNFLCVSGGIGVTPVISTAKQLLYQIEEGRPIKNLHFIWTGRDSAIIESIFKPNELKKLVSDKDQNIVQTFFHCTDVKINNDIEKKQANQNSVELVKYSKGRPEFSKYFEDAFKVAKESTCHLVGVIVCGPQTLINIVEQNASFWSKDGIRFDVHSEIFEF